MLPGTAQQVNVPENAAGADLVLILQVGAVAPLEHRHRQHVDPGGDQGGNVKLAVAVRHLAVTRQVPVDPHEKEGVHAVKVQINFLRHFFFSQ